MKQAYILLLLVVVLFLAWQITDVLFLIVGAILFGVGLEGLIEYVSKKTQRSWAISATLVISILVIFIAGIVGASIAVADDMAEFTKALPNSLDGVKVQLEERGWPIPQGILEPIDYSFLRITSLQTVKTALRSVIDIVAGVLIMFAIALYVGVIPRLHWDPIYRELPNMQKVIDNVKKVWKRWLLGRLSSMLIITIFTTLGLWILGVPFPLILGALAGLLSFIPNLGPILGFLPAAIIAAGQGPQVVLYVALLYLFIQAVESYAITPYIEKEAVHIPPAYTLGLEVIFGVLFGLLGVIFAVPLAVAIWVGWKTLQESRA